MFKVLLVLCLVCFLAIPLFAQSVGIDWVRRYNGSGNSSDYAYAIALDDSGNLYVTGESWGSGTGFDYATVKYDPEGNQLWVQRYNASANGYDEAYAIALDGSGNIYVTGGSDGSGTSRDYLTMKYAPDGTQLWAKRYNGPGNFWDAASAIALDGSGNVYVTGFDYNSGTSRDYATVKYDPDGNQVWIQRYNGPGDFEDRAYALALDGSNNVYVTGFSGYDYATIKYDPDGNQLWVQRYDGPANFDDAATAIALDGSGNVYVTGYSWGSGTSHDYATVKYNLQGNQVWVQRYNGPANGYDAATAITLDGSGNIYVTGTSDGSGTSSDYATVKYDPDGNQLWVQRYDGLGNSGDAASAIALDGSGNIYVTGYSRGSGTSYDYATVKYDPQGNQVWVKRYNGQADSSDYAYAIALDGSNNVYVTGHSYGSGTYDDYATVKYVQFLSGDANKDGQLSVLDVIYLINYLFKGSPAPVPILQVGDVDCNGKVNVSDVIYLINYLFKGWPAPAC